MTPIISVISSQVLSSLECALTSITSSAAIEARCRVWLLLAMTVVSHNVLINYLLDNYSVNIVKAVDYLSYFCKCSFNVDVHTMGS